MARLLEAGFEYSPITMPYPISRFKASMAEAEKQPAPAVLQVSSPALFWLASPLAADAASSWPMLVAPLHSVSEALHVPLSPQNVRRAS